MTKNTKVNEPKTGRKGGRLTKSKRLLLLDTIRLKYEKDGSFNKLAFARENNINRETLGGLIEELKIDMDSLTVVHVDMKQLFTRMESRMLYLWDKLQEKAEEDDRPNTRAELNIMKELRELIKEKYKLLQEFGDAPKVAENLNIQGTIIHGHIDLEKDSEGILLELNGKS